MTREGEGGRGGGVVAVVYFKIGGMLGCGISGIEPYDDGIIVGIAWAVVCAIDISASVSTLDGADIAGGELGGGDAAVGRHVGMTEILDFEIGAIGAHAFHLDAAVFQKERAQRDCAANLGVHLGVRH